MPPAKSNCASAPPAPTAAVPPTPLPAKDALVYVYQTSAKGWYSARAPHLSGNGGDQGHARLFGYVVADERGRFEVRTIHPQGYPGTELPAHIHVEVFRNERNEYARMLKSVLDRRRSGAP